MFLSLMGEEDFYGLHYHAILDSRYSGFTLFWIHAILAAHVQALPLLGVASLDKNPINCLDAELVFTQAAQTCASTTWTKLDR